VLTVDNFYSSGEFTSEDLELLQAAADHISVVINQAQLMKKEKEYRRQLEKVHLDLKNKHMLLEQTLKIHKKLTNIVLKDKGFEEIIKLLSDMIGYPTVVYNLFLKVVAAILFNHCSSKTW
jgi:hypothetical protein